MSMLRSRPVGARPRRRYRHCRCGGNHAVCRPSRPREHGAQGRTVRRLGNRPRRCCRCRRPGRQRHRLRLRHRRGPDNAVLRDHRRRHRPDVRGSRGRHGAHPPRSRGRERPGRRPRSAFPLEGDAGDCLTEGEEGKFPLIGEAGEPESIVADILANPAAYYVNVHTGEFPDGAIRGQLVSVQDHG